MTFLVLGISHRSAPMSVLDAIALDSDGVEALAAGVRAGDYVDGACVLSTCNRLEVIADASAFHGGLADVGSALVDATGLDWTRLSEHVYVYYDAKAVEHLLTLACGLDSMAVGEAQILGQLRSAYVHAQQAGQLTKELGIVLQQALRVGKRAHAETELDSVSQSLLDKALTSAEAHIGSLERASALVVGAGAMSGLSVATLQRAGVARITVMNRTVEKAERLVAPVGGRAVELTADTLTAEIADADLIVSVTGSRGTVLSREDIIAGMQADFDQQPNKFLVDLALPRDIDPSVRELPHIRLIGLAELSEMFAESDLRSPSGVVEIVAEVRSIIRDELAAYRAEHKARSIAPTVTALRSHAETTVAGEFERLSRKIGAKVDGEVLDEIRTALKRTADKLVHTPTVRVKQLSVQDSDVDYAAALTQLFDLSATSGRRAEPQRIDRSKVSVTAPGVTPVTARTDHHVEADGLRPVADHTLDVVEPAHYAGRTVKLGTRRSRLARSQSTAVAQQIAAQTGWRVEIVEVVTEGDVNMSPLAAMGGSGVFVSAVRTALLTGKIDIAVHSLKDLPTAPAAGIDLVAVPPRVDPSDVLIARDGMTLAELPAGAVLGTGSPRRAAQLRAARPDIEVRGVRGNVDTRIKHVTDGRLDGVVLAAAGVRRIGRLAEVTDVLDAAVMLPAPGQGALAVECRAANADVGEFDTELRAALSGIHDPDTALAVQAERAILAHAEAGCSAPIGALAEIDGNALTLTGVMADDTGRLQRVTRTADLTTASGADDRPVIAKELGSAIADELLTILGVVPDTVTGANAPSAHIDPRSEHAAAPDRQSVSEVSR